jgi:hypothetical protein
MEIEDLLKEIIFELTQSEREWEGHSIGEAVLCNVALEKKYRGTADGIRIAINVINERISKLKPATPTLPVWLDEKWQRIKAGHKEPASDGILDMLANHFRDREDAEADLFFKHLRSIINPRPIGTKDRYVVWIKQTQE